MPGLNVLHLLLELINIVTAFICHCALQIEYVSRDNMGNFIASCREEDVPITPWFKLIENEFLYQWWDNLHDIDKVSTPDLIIRR